MLEQRDRISRELPVRTSHLLISLTVPEDYAVLKPPVPYFLIFHPPPQGGLPASSSMHLLSHSISLVDKQSHNQIVSGIQTIVLAVDSEVSLS
jgi:hypothetical protein